MPEGDPADTAIAIGPGGRAVIKRARDLPYAEWIVVEARALAALASTELPVPRVIGVHERDTPVRDAWLVTTALPGQPLSAVLEAATADARRSWCDRLGRMLARIHGTAVPAALREVDATPWERRRHNRLPAERAAEALQSAHIERRPAAPRVLVHGDFTPDNVIADGDAIIGVIDWPGAGTGDPRFDVATALLSLGGEGEGSAFVRGYLDELATRNPELRAHFKLVSDSIA